MDSLVVYLKVIYLNILSIVMVTEKYHNYSKYKHYATVASNSGTTTIVALSYKGHGQKLSLPENDGMDSRISV